MAAVRRRFGTQDRRMTASGFSMQRRLRQAAKSTYQPIVACVESQARCSINGPDRAKTPREPDGARAAGRFSQDDRQHAQLRRTHPGGHPRPSRSATRLRAATDRHHPGLLWPAPADLVRASGAALQLLGRSELTPHAERGLVAYMRREAMAVFDHADLMASVRLWLTEHHYLMLRERDVRRHVTAARRHHEQTLFKAIATAVPVQRDAWVPRLLR